ncbi:hypothetical protein [Nocardia mangyaensis]|nr:hypothetical protein [Nocardia mangyaensis]
MIIDVGSSGFGAATADEATGGGTASRVASAAHAAASSRSDTVENTSAICLVAPPSAPTAVRAASPLWPFHSPSFINPRIEICRDMDRSDNRVHSADHKLWAVRRPSTFIAWACW